MPTLISSQQAAHVKNRFIGESGRLISDITEKAFDSLDHSFLISVLKKFGFGKNFIIWIEILLKNQQSCLIQKEALAKVTKSQHTLSDWCQKFQFFFIKKHPEIKDAEIFEHCFLYTAYVDDTTFFLKDAQSFENLVEIFNTFLFFPD